MATVKLIKALSYRGHGVLAKSGTPLSVSDEKAKELMETGFFAIADVETQEAKVTEDTEVTVDFDAPVTKSARSSRKKNKED